MRMLGCELKWIMILQLKISTVQYLFLTVWCVSLSLSGWVCSAALVCWPQIETLRSLKGEQLSFGCHPAHRQLPQTYAALNNTATAELPLRAELLHTYISHPISPSLPPFSPPSFCVLRAGVLRPFKLFHICFTNFWPS